MSRRALSVVVPLEGRGDLPLALFRGVPLVERAVLTVRTALPDAPILVTMGEADRDRVEAWAGSVPGLEVGAPGSSRGQDGDLLVHDPLCPGVDADLIARVLSVGEGGARSVAAYRPVTDTLKVVEDGIVTATLDRESVVAIASPVLVAHSVRRPALDLRTDLTGVVEAIRTRGPLEYVEAPPLARRVADLAALRVLEALGAVLPSA